MNTPDSVNLDPGNSAQFDQWNDRVGQTWARFQTLLDRQVGPLGHDALLALAPQAGERIVDVGCGCGETTLQLAERVGPGGKVLGLDVSSPMLEVARTRTPTQWSSVVEYRRGDAQVEPLPPASFDALYSRFGVMFFADPRAAFANLKRALKPGGRLAFVCWQPLAENDWMRLPLQAAQSVLPPIAMSPPRSPGPFAFDDENYLREILSSAGLTDITQNRLERNIGAGDVDDSLQLALRVGPLGTALREHPEYRDQVKAGVRAVLEQHLTAEGVRMRATVRVVTARV